MQAHLSPICVFSQYNTALLAALLAACGPRDSGSQPAGSGDSVPVRTGIDVVATEGAGPIAGGRVGLITNHTGLSSDGRSTIDVLHAHPEIELVALFAPEHGIRGDAEAGAIIEDGRDTRTGLPVHSLYGEVNTPTAAMLEGIDVLVFDIQDIGTRYYTYPWTMALALRTAAENSRRFVVLDRPNPLGGEQVQGNVLDSAFASFVGLYPVPMRHGLTVGELAQLLNAEYGMGADLQVVKMSGWQRAQWYDATGLPWVAPSPNMPTLESATHYPGTCLFEGTNLSVGRGTPQAFQQIGAPWLSPEAVIERMAAMALPGVRFEAVTFVPESPGDGKYDGENARGIRFHVTDRASYDPTRTGVAALIAIRAVHPDRFEFLESHFDRLAGTDRLRLDLLANGELDSLTAGWRSQIADFEERRRAHLLYP